MTAGTADFEVIVIGGGNAGFSAAHAAAERGRQVVLFERGTAEMAGGNSFYTAGATRIAHNGFADLAEFVEPDERHPHTEVPPYSRGEYLADLDKVTEGRADPELARVLVTEAQDTVRWLHSLGLRYRLMYERQAYQRRDAAKLGTEVRYGRRATALVVDDGRVVGVGIDDASGSREFGADSVVLASGGFESNSDWREQHLGRGWRNAKVAVPRTTPAR
jgi:tricarballylate dehydrogenase